MHTTRSSPGRNRLLTIGRSTTGLMPVTRARATANTASSAGAGATPVCSVTDRNAGPSANDVNSPRQCRGSGLSTVSGKRRGGMPRRMPSQCRSARVFCRCPDAEACQAAWSRGCMAGIGVVTRVARSSSSTPVPKPSATRWHMTTTRWVSAPPERTAAIRIGQSSAKSNAVSCSRRRTASATAAGSSPPASTISRVISPDAATTWVGRPSASNRSRVRAEGNRLIM
ncbi:hypothetical protein GCM10027610_075820 [Dactylosporangium cerinum]